MIRFTSLLVAALAVSHSKYSGHTSVAAASVFTGDTFLDDASTPSSSFNHEHKGTSNLRTKTKVQEQQ